MSLSISRIESADLGFLFTFEVLIGSSYAVQCVCAHANVPEVTKLTILKLNILILTDMSQTTF